MENYSNLAIDLVEQSLLCMYYLYAPSWEKFLQYDDTPDAFKTGKELRDKEIGKRIVLASKKVCSIVKSGAFCKYINFYPPFSGYFATADFEFDLSQYFQDQKCSSPLFSADLVTDVQVNTVRKFFRKVEQKTEIEKAQITLSEVIIPLNEAVAKCIAALKASGMLVNNYISLSYNIVIGAKDNPFKYELAALDAISAERKTFKFDIEKDSTTGERTLVGKEKYLTIQQRGNGECVISVKREGSNACRLCLIKTFFDRFIPSRDILIQLLAKYFSINVITLEEIEKTLLSCPTLTEFNQWLEERAKSVVVSENREIEHV
jgi:hypothetical protein